jgi:hypothetical protein
MSAERTTGTTHDRLPGTLDARTDGGGMRVARSTYRDERSIGDLIKELQSESSTLLRQEVELAKAEMRETLGTYTRNAISVAIGGALLLAALFGLLWTVNMALTALLEGAVGLETAVWLSPLILTVALAVIGMSMVKGGVNRIREESIVPRRATATLKEEKQWLKHRNG